MESDLNASWKSNKDLVCSDNVIVFGGKYFFLHQENSGQHQCDYLLSGKVVNKNNIENFKFNIINNLTLSNRYSFKYCHLICVSKITAHKKVLLDEFGVEVFPMFDKFLFGDFVLAPDMQPDDFFIGDTHTHSVGALKHIWAVLDYFGISVSDSYEIKKKLFKFNGDLFSKINRPENDEVLLESVNDIQPKGILLNLSSYLKGTSGSIYYSYNENAFLKKRLVTFGDSFISANLRAWGIFFEEVIHFRIPYVEESLVDSLKPDFVITSNTERYLVDVPSLETTPTPFLMRTLTSLEKPLSESDAELLLSLFTSPREQHVLKIPLRHKSLNDDSLFNLTENDVKKNRDNINYIIEVASNREGSNIKLSLYLMKLAHKFRPNSDFIKNKLEEYESKINKDIT